MDPPVSEARAALQKPAFTEAAAPPELPPETLDSSELEGWAGLITGPK